MAEWIRATVMGLWIVGGIYVEVWCCDLGSGGDSWQEALAKVFEVYILLPIWPLFWLAHELASD